MMCWVFVEFLHAPSVGLVLCFSTGMPLTACYIITLETKTINIGICYSIVLLFHQLIDNLLVISSC